MCVFLRFSIFHADVQDFAGQVEGGVRLGFTGYADCACGVVHAACYAVIQATCCFYDLCGIFDWWHWAF